MLSLSRRALRRFRHARGSTDPILVVAGIAITLVLLVGGSFAISGLIRSAQDVNAKQDLDRVASAQAAVMASRDAYEATAVGPRVLSSKVDRTLLTEELGIEPGADNTLVVTASGTGWAAMVQSASGATYLRTSASNDIVELDVSNIRDDFTLVTVDGTVLTDSNGQATAVSGTALRFPTGLTPYAMAWSWVDALYGLDPLVTPPPGPNGERPTAPETPVEEAQPIFQTGPGNYELKSVVWDQMSPTQVCATLTVRGTGGTVEGWYLLMDATSVPLNGDFNKNNYSFPTWGYGFDGNFTDGVIKVVGQNLSQWNNFSTLTEGQERTFRICDYYTPRPPVTSAVVLETLSETPGEWTWEARYRVSAPEAEFYTAWKVQIDVSAVNGNYKGSQPFNSNPGPADLKITQISPNVIEVEGIGWPTTGLRSDKSLEFKIGR